MNKHILAIGNNDMMITDNGDGTKTVYQSGVSQTFKGNRIVDYHMKSDKCQHGVAYKTYAGPDGELWHCPTCNATLDEHGDVVKANSGIPF